MLENISEHILTHLISLTVQKHRHRFCHPLFFAHFGFLELNFSTAQEVTLNAESSRYCQGLPTVLSCDSSRGRGWQGELSNRRERVIETVHDANKGANGNTSGIKWLDLSFRLVQNQNHFLNCCLSKNRVPHSPTKQPVPF